LNCLDDGWIIPIVSPTRIFSRQRWDIMVDFVIWAPLKIDTIYMVSRTKKWTKQTCLCFMRMVSTQKTFLGPVWIKLPRSEHLAVFFAFLFLNFEKWHCREELSSGEWHCHRWTGFSVVGSPKCCSGHFTQEFGSICPRNVIFQGVDGFKCFTLGSIHSFRADFRFLVLLRCGISSVFGDLDSFLNKARSLSKALK
jgi:hypothetical protein